MASGTRGGLVPAKNADRTGSRGPRPDRAIHLCFKDSLEMATNLPPNPDPCARCGGLLDFVEDPAAPYWRCLQCGCWIFLGKAPERGGAEDAPRECAWYPTKDETIDRYRVLRETILREKISPDAARERFGISRRT